MKHIDYTNASWDEIISASLNNDEDAKKELVEKTYKIVANTCKKFTHGEKEVTKDLIQDVYLKVFKNLSTIKDPVAFPHWIKMITCNTCQDFLRAQKNNRVDYFAPGENEEESDPYETFADKDHQVDPDKKLDTKETRNMMKEIIEDLPDAQRTALVMYYYDDLSVKDIADVTNVSENTVKSRLNYARQKIKERVEEYEKKYGIRLHGVAPVSFLTYIRFFLQADSEDVLLAAKVALPTALIVKQVAGTTVAGVVKGAIATEVVGKAGFGLFIKGAISTVTAKAIITTVALIVTAGSIFGVAYAINNKATNFPAEENSLVMAEEITSTIDINNVEKESSFTTNKTPKQQESSKAESELSLEESSDAHHEVKTESSSIEEIPVQEEASQEAPSTPEESSVFEFQEESSAIQNEESSIHEESSSMAIEETSEVDDVSTTVTEESSSTTPEEESSEEACVHQLYYCRFHHLTCEHASYYENYCYDCGYYWTVPCSDALGGTCDLPSEPWIFVGDTFTVTRGFMFTPEETYQDSNYKYCPNCKEAGIGIVYTGALDPGYYVDGTYFDSFSDAETYATENNITTYTVQYTITSIDRMVDATAPTSPVKLPAENRPPDWADFR